VPEVVIKAPLVHQEPVDESDAPRKVLRWGRRGGKTRWAYKAALTGHGPDGDWSQVIGRDEAERVDAWSGPLFRGVIHGYDVVWLARDYPQARAIWQEEVKPGLRGVTGIDVHDQERRVTFRGLGSLHVRTAENVDSIRGIGARVIGVIVDEAAFIDLEAALKDVILPVLVDNVGWLVLMSTTNAGPDGSLDQEGTKRTPSYFNMICEQIRAGERGPDWREFYATAHDNPALSLSAIESLVDEYTLDSPELAQEVYAKLIVGGSGVAFPEWDDTVHLATYLPERDTHNVYRWAVGGDWGYAKPGGLWLIATSAERSLVRWEFYFRGQTPYDAGYEWGQQLLRFPAPEWQAIDTPAVADGGPNILEELQRGFNDAYRTGTVAFVNPPKGSGSRLTKAQLLHEHLKCDRDAIRAYQAEHGELPTWLLPKLQVHATDCPNLVRTLPRLPKDPKKPGDVDTTAEDHPYDGVCAWLMARTPYVERSPRKDRHPDDHEGVAKRYNLGREPEPTGRWSRT